MSITTLLGTRLLSGLGALAIASSLVGGSAIADAAKGKGRGNEVAEAHHDLKDRIEPERQAIAELRQQLADEYAKADPDEALIQRLHDEIQMHRDKIADMRHEVLMDMHDDLDADQRAKVAEKIAGKHDGEHGKGKGKSKASDDDEHGKPDKKGDKKGKPDKKAKAEKKGKPEAEATDR